MTTNFNSDQFRQPWESDIHWEIRKEFLETHKDNFHEDKLLCFAQMYSNVKFLNCRYPKTVMQEIDKFSKDLSNFTKLKQKRRRISVEFVKEKNSPSSSIMKTEISSDVSSSKQNKFLMNQCYHSSVEQSLSSCVSHFSPYEKPTYHSPQELVPKGSKIITPTKIINFKMQDIAFFRNMWSEINVHLDKKRTYIEAIFNASNKLAADVNFKVDIDPQSLLPVPIYKCDLYIRHIFICSAKSSSKKKARLEAASIGIKILMDLATSIQPHSLKEPAMEFRDSDFRDTKISNSKEACCSSNVSQITQDYSQITQDTPQVTQDEIKKHLKNSGKRMLGNSFQTKFVIIEYDHEIQQPIKILYDSASFSHIPISYEFEDVLSIDKKINLIRADVILNGEIVGTGSDLLKHNAKQAAAASALEFLKTVVHTIRIKNEYEGFIISRNQLIDTSGSSNAVSDSSIGCKMLKMMGWTGGGIGKIGNSGIIEPIRSEKTHMFRQGLGFSNSKQDARDFSSRAEALIQDYAKSDTTSDLIFSAEFSKDERKIIHRIANKYHLKNTSKGGKGDNRHIVISRRFTAEELLHHLLQVGGSTFKYELKQPSCNN